VTLQVELVVPEGELWSGAAQRVIAKTLDGDLGVLTGHTPVLGILAAGSLVRILPEQDGSAGEEIQAAILGGFLSVASDRVSILARQAQLATDVDRSAAQTALDEALGAGQEGPGGEEADEVRYARALLRAAGDQS
jgi:F-type H+-transporting ATPase subunit epsilon